MSNKDKDNVLIQTLGYLLVIPASILLILWKCWVVTFLWAWYIVPHFGLAPISIANVFGLTIIVCLIRPIIDYEQKVYPVKHILLVMFKYPAYALVMGWIGTFFL